MPGSARNPMSSGRPVVLLYVAATSNPSLVGVNCRVGLSSVELASFCPLGATSTRPLTVSVRVAAPPAIDEVKGASARAPEQRAASAAATSANDDLRRERAIS